MTAAQTYTKTLFPEDSPGETLDSVMFFSFYSDGRPIDEKAENGGFTPKCAITLRSSGDMTYTAGSENPRLKRLLKRCNIDPARAVFVKQIHSQKVFALKEPKDARGKEGDGIITDERAIVPCVTVADCAPIYFYDQISKAFGAVHSGYKGTGAAAAAIAVMRDQFGAKPQNICAVIGPHIRDCCYSVDSDRANRYANSFGADCAFRDGNNWRISLLKANISILLGAGVSADNIAFVDKCTYCGEDLKSRPIFGSFRREGPQKFTRMAAFAYYEQYHSGNSA